MFEDENVETLNDSRKNIYFVWYVYRLVIDLQYRFFIPPTEHQILNARKYLKLTCSIKFPNRHILYEIWKYIFSIILIISQKYILSAQILCVSFYELFKMKKKSVYGLRSLDCGIKFLLNYVDDRKIKFYMKNHFKMFSKRSVLKDETSFSFVILWHQTFIRF